MTKPYKVNGEIDAMDPGEFERCMPGESWFAVADDGGVVAYVGDETIAHFLAHALRIRAKRQQTLKGLPGSWPHVERFLDGHKDPFVVTGKRGK